MAIVTTLIEASGHTMNTTALFFTPGNRKTSCMQFTQCISTVYKSLWNEWKSVNVLHKALFTPNTKCQLHFLQMLWSWFTPFALVSWVVEKNQVMLARERQESNTLFLLTPSQVSASSCQLNGREQNVLFPDNILLPSNCKRKAVYFTQCRHGTLVASSPWGWMQTLG